jgi:hypothetical protein
VILLEIAQKIKDAGLPWEPQEGDAYYCNRGYIDVHHGHGSDRWVLEHIYPGTFFHGSKTADYSWTVFAPRLDQTLSEIERLGYFVTDRQEREGYMVELYHWCDKPDPGMPSHGFWWLKHSSGIRSSREEAAAAALLWILTKEAPNA